MKRLLKYFLIFLLILIVLSVGLSFIPSFRYLQTLAKNGFQSSIIDYKIFPNRVVKPSSKPLEWAKAKNYNQPPLSDEENKLFEQYSTIAFLVIQNKEIKVEKYWSGFDEKSLSGSFSMAKSIISLLIGVAIEEGKIKNVQQKVSDFIPEFKEGTKANITIQDLLTMSSGLEWDEGYGNPFALIAKAYFGEDLNELVTALNVKEPSGKIWKYQSCDTQLLGIVLQKAVGKTISNYASEKLWQPLGASSEALWSLDEPNGDEKAFCCFNTNARDYARLGQLVLDSGKWNNQQLVPASYIQEATAPASHLRDYQNKEPVKHYGYQFWIAYHKNMTVTCFRGVKGQYILVIPEKKAVIVRLGHNRDNEMIRFTPKDLYTYIDIALKRLDN